MNPDSLQLFRSGAALDGLGKTDAALGKYSDAIKADPKSALAYYARGVLLATRQRAYVRAISDFDKVLVLEPANYSALVRRGEAYSELGDFGHAFADLNRAIELDPTNPTAYFVRGLANDRRKQTAKALEDFGAVLRPNPHDIGGAAKSRRVVRETGRARSRAERLQRRDRDSAHRSVGLLQPRLHSFPQAAVRSRRSRLHHVDLLRSCHGAGLSRSAA